MKRDLEKKSTLFKIKITTYIKGALKNKFIDDLRTKGITEAELGRQIIESHYKNKVGQFRNVY